MQKNLNFSAINLGCSKNLVDLEYTVGNILSVPTDVKVQFFPDPEDEEVEYVLVNTCGFLSSSREEAEETMSYYDSLGKKLIVIGCYVPVKNDDFVKTLKNLHSLVSHEDSHEVADMLIGKGDIGEKHLYKEKISKLQTGLGKLKKQKLQQYLNTLQGDRKESKAFIWGTENVRAFFHAPFGYEYLKIAEGCNNNCSFCIIPKIRGRQKSRTIEDILEEVRIMVKSGIKEIEIISQDTTRYGVDLYKSPQLLELLQKIDEIEGDFQYRLFYMYPDILSLTHLEKLAKLKKMLPYFDMPFQHISQNVLKNMGRFYDQNHIFKLLDTIKILFPKAFFHTNFIVGFPGETQSDFEELCAFAQKYEFDSVSLFGYHDEPLAESSQLSDKVSTEIISARVEKLSNIIAQIYAKKDASRTGKILQGIIHDIDEESKVVTVREMIRAPEVDEYDIVSFEAIISGEREVGEQVTYKN